MCRAQLSIYLPVYYRRPDYSFLQLCNSSPGSSGYPSSLSDLNASWNPEWHQKTKTSLIWSHKKQYNSSYRRAYYWRAYNLNHSDWLQQWIKSDYTSNYISFYTWILEDTIGLLPTTMAFMIQVVTLLQRWVPTIYLLANIGEPFCTHKSTISTLFSCL